MADLITLDRALAQIPNASDEDGPLVASLISAASSTIEKYCNRTFALGTYDELHTVTGPTCSLWVNNPPVVDLQAVRSQELPAMYIQLNDAGNTTQQGTVEITSTGLILKRVYNGTATTTTLAFTSYPTFTDLFTAVNGLGNGWAATGMNSQFALWQTSQLTTNYGTRNARNVSCPLLVFWWYLASYKTNKLTGEVNWIAPSPGFQTYRIEYQGGYAEVPDEIQQACAELVQLAFATKRANPLMTSETLDKYSYTRAFPAGWFDLLSTTARMALAQYRVPRLTVQGVDAKG